MTMLRGETSAETCRLNGWDVGTVLVGDREEIVITSVGEAIVLAKAITRDGVPVKDMEWMWNLSLREWEKARFIAQKSETQLAAEELMRAAGQTIRETPGRPTDDVRILRAKLILEKALETIDGLGVSVWFWIKEPDAACGLHMDGLNFTRTQNFDLIEAIDGCCDLNVVVAGALSALGVPDIPVQREVERSNRSKLLPDGTLPPHPTVPGTFGKGPNYTPPDIISVLAMIEDEGERDD